MVEHVARTTYILKFGEFKQRRLPYALPPVDVASSMFCESVCQQLSGDYFEEDGGN
jgi:hypothetical protein